MMDIPALKQLVLGDFRERTRRYSFLLTLLGTMFFGYLVITDPNVPAIPGEPVKAKRTIAFSFLFNGFGPPLSNRSLKSVQDLMVESIDQQVAGW